MGKWENRAGFSHFRIFAFSHFRIFPLKNGKMGTGKFENRAGFSHFPIFPFSLFPAIFSYSHISNRLKKLGNMRI